MAKTIKNIVLYRDKEMTDEWSDLFGSYDLMVINNKAKVIQNSTFGNKNESRLNKLTKFGNEGNIGLYHLIAEGEKVYFKM